MGKLSGKTCVVIAAGQGIGRAIAEAYAVEGGRVIAVDRNGDVLEAWARPGGLEFRAVDATDEAAVAALAAEFPETSVLLNGVGAVSSNTAATCTAAELELSFRLNVVTAANAIRAFLPKMLERGDGSIINIASVVSSIKAAPDRFAYSTAKAAMLGLTRSVARDFITQGVRCNSISPGTTESPSLAERIAAQGDEVKARAAFIARQPMGRLGRPEEMAAAAVLLASDDSRFMTGENIVIDGGMSL